MFLLLECHEWIFLSKIVNFASQNSSFILPRSVTNCDAGHKKHTFAASVVYFKSLRAQSYDVRMTTQGWPAAKILSSKIAV